MPPSDKHIRLSLPANPRYLAYIRQGVAEACRCAGVPEIVTQTVVSAVSEACNNAIEHAYGFDEKGRLDLLVDTLDEEIHVELLYLDADFDPERIPQARLGSLQEGGYGVFLMRQLMDKVEYRKEAGNRIRLCLQKSWKDGRNG